MKQLKIMMHINANNQKSAESIATRELGELAKAIALRNGSFMIGGECDVEETFNGDYKANATMNVNEYPGLNESVYTVQALWMTKPEIIKSAIFVSETESKENEKPVKTCKICGCVLEDDDYAIVNEDDENEYNLCYECLDNEKEIVWCDTCDCYVDGRIENPVTHRKTICPHCGDNLD